jgi:metal-responsive CopG/Arc/MetJ family transcriptional regulator
MSSSDDHVELEIAFDEALLDRIDRFRARHGHESRSDVVATAIDAADQ